MSKAAAAPLRPYTEYPRIADDFPELVALQRTLEASIAPVAPLVEQEKAVRAQIDARLVAAGLTTAGQGVTCDGYDVVHHTRKGSTAINADRLVEQLVAKGVKRTLVVKVLAASLDTGDPSAWASVKASKGSVVSPPAAVDRREDLAARRRRA